MGTAVVSGSVAIAAVGSIGGIDADLSDRNVCRVAAAYYRDRAGGDAYPALAA